MSALRGDPRHGLGRGLSNGPRPVEPPLRRPAPHNAAAAHPAMAAPINRAPLPPRSPAATPAATPAAAAIPAPRAAVEQPVFNPERFNPQPYPRQPFDPLAEPAPAAPSALHGWSEARFASQAATQARAYPAASSQDDLLMRPAPRAPQGDVQYLPLAETVPAPGQGPQPINPATPGVMPGPANAPPPAAPKARRSLWRRLVSRAPQSQPLARRDPSPSRLAYRLQRLWLTPTVRRGVKAGLPALILAAALGLWLGDESRRLALVQTAAELRLAFENRPEFQVSRLVVRAETPEVTQAIEQRLALDLPVSSFHLDLEALRRRVEALDAVETAALRIRSGGALEISVVERVPAMVWRHHGGLELVDADGIRVARLVAREARADLPLIAGEGAPAAIAEAQRILAAAAPLDARLRGLVRVGERRWDLVLERDQRILLPATGAVAALERVLALDTAQDLLARDVTVVDLRDPSRPTIRMSQPAMAELHRIRNQATGVQNR